MRTEPNTSSGCVSELGAGKGKLLCMRWLLEKPVREKEKEEEAEKRTPNQQRGMISPLVAD